MLPTRTRDGAWAAYGALPGASPFAAEHPAYRMAPLRAACVGQGPCQRRSRTRQRAGCLFFCRSSRSSRRNPGCIRNGNSLSLVFPGVDPCSEACEVMLDGHFVRRATLDVSSARRPRRRFGGDMDAWEAGRNPRPAGWPSQPASQGRGRPHPLATAAFDILEFFGYWQQPQGSAVQVRTTPAAGLRLRAHQSRAARLSRSS